MYSFENNSTFIRFVELCHVWCNLSVHTFGIHSHRSTSISQSSSLTEDGGSGKKKIAKIKNKCVIAGVKKKFTYKNHVVVCSLLGLY